MLHLLFRLVCRVVYRSERWGVNKSVDIGQWLTGEFTIAGGAKQEETEQKLARYAKESDRSAMNDDGTAGMREEVLYPMAAEMARRGATRGMIVQKLQKKELDELAAGLVADRALRAVATRKRIEGVGVIVAGLAILAAALGSTALFRGKIPVVLGMFGLIVLGLGISQVTHRARLPKEPYGSKPKIR